MRVILNLQWKWKSELFSPLVAVQDCNAPQSRDLMILGQQLDFEAKGGVRGEQDDVHAASDDRAHGVDRLRPKRTFFVHSGIRSADLAFSASDRVRSPRVTRRK